MGVAFACGSCACTALCTCASARAQQTEQYINSAVLRTWPCWCQGSNTFNIWEKVSPRLDRTYLSRLIPLFLPPLSIPRWKSDTPPFGCDTFFPSLRFAARSRAGSGCELRFRARRTFASLPPAPPPPFGGARKTFESALFSPDSKQITFVFSISSKTGSFVLC